jgi:acetate kinase
MQEKLGREDVNLIICHIGSGASISAIKNGKCYDTTMGLSPLDGLMMGTRSGAIDPSIIEYVCGETGKTVGEITNELNKKSGYLGVSGYSDSRDVENAAAEGNEDAQLAITMYNNRVAKYIADYYIELEGKVDAIVFTAGVGENGIEARADMISKLAPLGVKLNAEANNNIAGYRDNQEGLISAEDSSIAVHVVPTNEELMIIKDTYELVK